MKKTIAVLLCVTLLVSCFCGSVSAYSESTPAFDAYEQDGIETAAMAYDVECAGECAVTTAADTDAQISVIEDAGYDESGVAAYEQISSNARTTSVPKSFYNLAAKTYTGSFSGVTGTMYTGYYFSTSANSDLYYKVTLYSDYTPKCQVKIRLYDITSKSWVTNVDYTTSEFDTSGLTAKVHAYNLNANHQYCVAVSLLSGLSFSGSFLVTHNSNYT